MKRTIGVFLGDAIPNRTVGRVASSFVITVSTWRVRGRELGMSASELEQFADAFEHREREVAQSIVRATSPIGSEQ